MEVGNCRNSQCGDWIFDSNGNLTVTSIPLGDPYMESLIQFHEALEAITCFRRHITDETVSAFDELFETERAKGLHLETDEDGDDPRAPYRREHFFATNIERQIAAEWGIDWKEYEKRIYGK